MSLSLLPSRLLWLFLAFALLRQSQTDFVSFLMGFDHCPGLGCDYRGFYVPQVALLSSGRMAPGWTSPPLLAMFFAALPGGEGAWLALNGVALGALVAACWRRIGAVGVPLVLLSMPVWHAIKWGQPSLLLAAAAVAVSTPEWLPPGRAGERLRGAVLGGAAALKLYPALWGALDLSARRWKVLAAAAIVGLIAGVALPALLLPGELNREMWGAVWTIQVEQRAASVRWAAQLGGQGIPATLVRWFEAGRVIPDPSVRDALLWVLPPFARRLIELAATAAVLWAVASRRRADVLERTAAAMLGFTLLLNPAWHHYFAFLPWVQAIVWARLAAQPSAQRGVWLLGLSIAFSSVGMIALADVGDLYWTLTRLGSTTLAAALALAALRATPRPTA